MDLVAAIRRLDDLGLPFHIEATGAGLRGDSILVTVASRSPADRMEGGAVRDSPARLLRASLRAAADLPRYFLLGDSAADAIANVAIALRRWPETLIYHMVFRRPPNYLNPTLYSEKVQWRKLFDRNPELITFCNKLASKVVARDRAPEVAVPELLWSGADPDLMPLEEIDPPYVVKANNRSGAIIAVRNEADLDVDAIRAECRRWLAARAHRRRVYEWAYGEVETRVFIERFIERSDHPGSPADLKIFVFGGRALYVYYRDPARDRRAIFDRDWQRFEWERWIPLEPGGPREAMDDDLPRLAGLEAAIEAAEAIAADVDHLRVDLYDIDGTVYFGEATVYASSGHKVWIPIGKPADPQPPDDVDRLWGSHWELPDIPRHTKLRRGLLG